MGASTTQYWFVNGVFNTIHVNFPSGYLFTDWLAAHPGYDPLIVGSVGAPIAQGGTGYVNPAWKTPGQKVLIRVINMGFETQPMHAVTMALIMVLINASGTGQ
jgi:hypothetical protein